MGQAREAIRGDDKIAAENRLWEKGIICINLAWLLQVQTILYATTANL